MTQILAANEGLRSNDMDHYYSLAQADSRVPESVHLIWRTRLMSTSLRLASAEAKEAHFLLCAIRLIST